MTITATDFNFQKKADTQKEAYDKYSLRLTELKKVNAHGRNFFDDNINPKEFEAFLSPSYPNQIGRKILALSGLSENFSDIAFVTLESKFDHLFDFLDNMDYYDIFSFMTEFQVGEFFLNLVNIYYGKIQNVFEEYRSAKATGKSFLSWIDEDKPERQKTFFSLASLIIQNPTTPVELLAELI